MAAFYTLLYIADRTDAPTIASADENERWPSLWLRHIGDLELLALWQLLDEESADTEGTLMGDLLFQSDDEETFVMAVPASFVASVSEIQDSQLAELAQAWNDIDELSHWESREIEETLNNLRAFGRQALAANKPILQVANI